VFDYRGYDTLGESFILLTAIAGSFVILSRSGKKSAKKEGEDQ
jgi:multisubunit Na+/H+ antiporter MnhB subunit